MRILFAILVCLAVHTQTMAQVLNFYDTEYYLSPDSTFSAGTQLLPSGESLANFNFSTASPEHPLFKRGIYYPISDCSNKNAWVRLQHIAHDPNGRQNGHNIEKTLNSPFLPVASKDRIGGWAGFLYDFRIFADENLQGSRANILGNPFPTNITVESLETLYNDGNTDFEWLSFEIKDQTSSGWTLNSINFTGINPYSSPGFSSDLHYSTGASPGGAPAGFSTDFPSGSKTIYAIDLNLSGNYHSEFRMSASGVSHFLYGYEFHTGGYQGMSMAFGQGPEVNATIESPKCHGQSDGSILLDVTGYEPIEYSWSNLHQGQDNLNLPAGEYAVLITDASGCESRDTFLVTEPDSLQGIIDRIEQDSIVVLQVFCTGGSGEYTYLWSNGSTGDSINPASYGSYSVTIRDENGCTYTASIDYVSIDEASMNENALRIYPNPVNQGMATLTCGNTSGELQLFASDGRIVYTGIFTAFETRTLNLGLLPPGFYFYRFGNEATGRLLICPM